MTASIERDLDALVASGVLRIERRNHRFRHTTGRTVEGGYRAGRRCLDCNQWAMGERPGGSADEVCPKATYRYVSDWFDGLDSGSEREARS